MIRAKERGKRGVVLRERERERGEREQKKEGPYAMHRGNCVVVTKLGSPARLCQSFTCSDCSPMPDIRKSVVALEFERERVSE